MCARCPGLQIVLTAYPDWLLRLLAVASLLPFKAQRGPTSYAVSFRCTCGFRIRRSTRTLAPSRRSQWTAGRQVAGRSAGTWRSLACWNSALPIPQGGRLSAVRSPQH